MVVAINEEEAMEVDEINETPATKTRVQSSLLDTFDLLRDSGYNFKLDGGAKLLTFLSRSEEDSDLDYTLKRIVRSLGANQLSMRTGYFSTLVLLLKQSPKITANQLLKLAKQELHAGDSKSEVGDVSVGRILLCGAALRSGLILRTSEQEQNDIIAMLISASSKKSYLKSAAYLFLVDFINLLDEEQFKSIIWKNLREELKKSLQEQTIDSLFLLMKANDKFPDTVKVQKFLGVNEILCEDTVHAICEKLMTVGDKNQTNHPIYEYIGEKIANSEHLQLFWTSGIDSKLTKHNRNRELVCIKMLLTILENIQGNYEVIPELLTKNFFKLSIDWFKGLQTATKFRNKREDEDDNKMMIKKEREVFNALAKTVKREEVPSVVRIEILKKLLFNPGDMNIAEITSTPVVKTIIISLEREGVKKAAKLFKAVLLNESKKSLHDGTDRAWFNYERLKASEYLSHLVTHPAILEDTKFRLNYMKVLMCFGFFKISGNEDITISADLSAAIKTSFYRCLNTRLPKVEGLVEVLRSLCTFIEENLSNERIKKKLTKQFPEENVECWMTLKKTCDNIEENTEKKKIDNVFLILLYQLGLFLFSEPKDVQMAKDSVKELASCYEHYKMDGKKTKKKSKDEELTNEEPEWIEVLVEVLLSILSSESSVLRAAVQCAFRLLIENLTPSSIHQIISVLDPDSDSNPLIQDDSDSNDESDGDDEDSNKNNKVDSNEVNVKESSDESSDDSNESDIEESDEDDEKIKIPDQLRMAVQKALGSAGTETDTESIDADNIGDEEGKQLDKALSEAFQLLRQGKNVKSKKDRKNKKTLTDFRVRVLDLVDIYLEKEPAMDICLAMIAPLMRCLEFCIQDVQQRELESRLRKTLKLLTGTRKFSSTDGVTAEILADYLKTTIEKGSRTQFIFQAIGDMVTECGTFIVHCSQKIEGLKTPSKKKKSSPLIDIYKVSLINFFQVRSCLLPIIFFHKILQIDWEGVYSLIPIVIDNTFDNNVRQFRRHEGLELLVGFYSALKRNKPENVAAKLRPIQLKLEEIIKKSLDENNEGFVVKDQFFKLLGKVLVHIEKFYAAIESESPINVKSLINLLVSSKKGMKIKRNKKEKEEKSKQIIVEQSETKTKPKKNKHKKIRSSKEPAPKKMKS